jgi:TonB family protein
VKPERAVQDLRRDMRAEAARTRSRSGGEVHVVVITTDFSLLSVLQQAGSPEHSFWQTGSADAAVDLLVSGRRGILILDLATLSGNLTNLLYRLELQFPDLVMLATGTREQESTVVTLVGKGRIYRFLHKPVSPARAGLFLGTATRRFLELRGESKPLPSVKELASSRPTKAILWSALAVLTVVGGGAALMVAMQREPAKAPVARSAPELTQPRRATQGVQSAAPVGPTQNADTAGMLSRYLSVAQGAYSAGRLVSPPGDNALEYYQSALQLQENNAEALLGIDRINITLETRVSQALQDGDAAAAAQALAVFEQAQPNAPQLASLRARLLALNAPATSRRPASSAPRSSLARVATPPKPSATTATVNVDQARTRIRNGQLIEPADSSALFFLRRAQEAGEDPSRLRVAATDLGQRLLDGVRSAWAADQNGQAQRLLEAASELDRQFDLSLPDLDRVVADSKRFASAGVEQARAQRLAAATQAREAGQLLEPAGSSAYDRLTALLADYPSAEDVLAERQRLAAALVAGGEAALRSGDRRRAQAFSERATGLSPQLPGAIALSQQVTAALRQPLIVPANSLPRIREVAPRYPRAAERDGIEGTVDVEFTIAEDGTTRDLVVRDSNPKQIFDSAAIDAVGKWVFKPVIRDGQPVEQRTVIKIQFSLKR